MGNTILQDMPTIELRVGEVGFLKENNILFSLTLLYVKDRKGIITRN